MVRIDDSHDGVDVWIGRESTKRGYCSVSVLSFQRIMKSMVVGSVLRGYFLSRAGVDRQFVCGRRLLEMFFRRWILLKKPRESKQSKREEVNLKYWC